MQAARLVEIELINTSVRNSNTLNKVIIQARIDEVNQIWSEVRSTHLEITVRDDAQQDAYVINNAFLNMRSTWEKTLDFLLSKLAESDQSTIVDNTISLNTPVEYNEKSGPTPAKLPKFDLPTFSGEYEEWNSFADLFKALVHDAPRVSDATKLQYLKSCLKGPASDLVKDIPITSVNHASTWKALEALYNKPRFTVSAYINALLNIPVLTKGTAKALSSFANEAQRIYRSLRNMKLPVDTSDIWFIEILSSRLDGKSLIAWEAVLSAKDYERCQESGIGSEVLSQLPTFADFTKFLETRAQAYSVVDIAKARSSKGSSTSNKILIEQRNIHHAPLGHSSSLKCALCGENHSIAKCFTFRKKSIPERRDEIRRLHLCYNCLGRHMQRECKSQNSCKSCKGKHHTMLHNDVQIRTTRNTNQAIKSSEINTETPSTYEHAVKVLTACVSRSNLRVIFATARVKILGPDGSSTIVRALLDQGSEATFVSESVAQLLQLPRESVQVSMFGLGGKTTGTAGASTQFRLCSLLDPKFCLETDALLLPRLTSKLPASEELNISLSQFTDITLADPCFNIPNTVDFIIGANIYGKLLKPGLKIISPSQLIAQDTVFGWILSGATQTSRRAGLSSSSSLQSFHCFTDEKLQDCLQKFWLLEELPPLKTSINPEAEICEKLFKETTTRDFEGRFILNLPLKKEIPHVADEMRRMAVASLASLHRRFERDPQLSKAYREFMDAYANLGHMLRVSASEIDNSSAWYLLHHAVIQSFPSNWKLRVVFDASRHTREKFCLNNFLLSGPALQNDLSLILLNWRRYRFVFTADIVKMFRQIRVAPRNQDLQRIVWSPSLNEPPVDYRLTTVTYGTTCAPFLAIRTLLQLADDEKSCFPLGARC